SPLCRHAQDIGDYDTADAIARRGLRIAEQVGLGSSVSFWLATLGRNALSRGDAAHASQLYERSRRMAASHADTPGERFAWLGLGAAARTEGRLDLAEQRLRNWLRDWRHEHSASVDAATALAELGYIAEARGDAEQAWGRHREAW